ncbi:NAD(P)-dependent dehydrogenase, short-chain alcohol dehydrogenase family [Burkholderia sp. OK233]|jgi:NAD(P)-dependent dehydrogenase (short-subunit alcohol dehydrogenase family)|nr:NAD(P)-dependent dehydrogenase, short-chain alcohol dehydrogenase family [Burkholderia sp. OK233]
MSISEMNPFSLEGEVALVTGATRGIGRACAAALGSAGAAVALGCRDLEAGTALAKELQEGGVNAMAVHMDMLSLASIEQAISAVESDLGPLSVLVNNAGLSHPAPAMNVTEADYDSMFDLNVKGAFFASQAAARKMAARARGSIINIASQAGLVALDGEPVYCMTKAAMIHMTQCLAVEWARHHIRVNAVAPTFIRTDSTKGWLEDEKSLNSLLARIPLRKIGEPENVAEPVVFLASEAAALITGATLKIDGGWTAV